MRKDELISAVVAANRKKPASGATKNGERSEKPKGEAKPAARRPRPTAAQKRLAAAQKERQRLHDLSSGQEAADEDRLILLVRDPYWLQASWEITPEAVARARTALGQNWHGAKPSLRVLLLAEDGATASTKQIGVHGGVNHWYVDVSEPKSDYRAEIGYATPHGEFYCLARSNQVRTPEPGVSEAVDKNWSDVARNADRVYAMSGGYSDKGASQELQEALEERLRRRLGRPTETRFVSGAGVADSASLDVEVDAELVIFGSASPHAHLTIHGEPVSLRSDGAFAVKAPFPERRQVVPVVASSADGLHQKTIIIGVERNTKSLEPRRRETAS